MRPELGSSAERRLLRSFRALDSDARETLLAFAEFLQSRARPAEAFAAVLEPVLEPRPQQESVVGAIQRLRRTYPMLDGGRMLNETSSLMAAHVLQGRAAAEVIDELEALFAARYDEYASRND
jgi:hypothetical protein